MIPLIITYVRHAVLGCYEGNATGLERFSCDHCWLIDGVSLSSVYPSCEEYDLCPVQDIEMVVDWFIVAMWGAIRVCNSSIGDASKPVLR